MSADALAFVAAIALPVLTLAALIGLAEQLGSVYIPTYAIVVTFLIMVLVLAVRPQGLPWRNGPSG